MESISGSVFKGALDIQASAAATLISGGAPMQAPAPQGQGGDDAARTAGLQAQGIGQKIDTTC